MQDLDLQNRKKRPVKEWRNLGLINEYISELEYVFCHRDHLRVVADDICYQRSIRNNLFDMANSVEMHTSNPPVLIGGSYLMALE